MTRLSPYIATASLTFLAACATVPPRGPLAPAGQPPAPATAAVPDLSNVPLIPRAVLFGNPVRAGGQISPDGSQFAFIAPRDGVMNLWVAPLSDIAAARPLTDEKKRPIRQYFWSPDSKQLLFVNDKGGDENFLLYAVDAATAARIWCFAPLRSRATTAGPIISG